MPPVAGDGPLGRLLAFLLPWPCLGCGEREAACELGLCRRCRGLLRAPPQPGCRQCARPLLASPPPADSLCGECRRLEAGYERLLTVWDYRPPFDSVIHALKFARLESLGAPLARSCLERLGDELAGHDLVVAIPLHPWRRLRRGFNQAEAIARPLAQALGLPLRRALRRSGSAAPQSRQPLRLRRARSRHVFKIRRAVAGRVLLVDDVVTTGATLRAAALALRRAGAEGVTALGIARTPGPDELPAGGRQSDFPPGLRLR